MTPEINVTKKKFIIRIEVQTLDSSDVFELKCDNVSLVRMSAFVKQSFSPLPPGGSICRVDDGVSTGFKGKNARRSELRSGIGQRQGFRSSTGGKGECQ